MNSGIKSEQDELEGVRNCKTKTTDEYIHWVAGNWCWLLAVDAATAVACSEGKDVSNIVSPYIHTRERYSDAETEFESYII